MQTKHYFSEKVTNPLLAGCTPIYLGCLNINNYFPNSIINLSGDLKKDLTLLVHILSNPMQFKKDCELTCLKDKIYLLRNLNEIYDHDVK